MKKDSIVRSRETKERGCRHLTSHLSFGHLLCTTLIFFAILGCQQTKPSLTYQHLLDDPVPSRAHPATLSEKSIETLMKEGFVKIGYIDLRMLTKSCRRYLLGGQNIREVCEKSPESDPLPWLLRKGGEVGGDLIVIEFEKSYTEHMDLLGIDAFYAKEFSLITAAVWRKAQTS